MLAMPIRDLALRLPTQREGHERDMGLVVVVLTLCVLGGLLVMLVAGGMAVHDAVSRLSPKHEEPSHISPHGVLSNGQRHHRMAGRFERVEDLALGWKNRGGSASTAGAPARVVDVRQSEIDVRERDDRGAEGATADKRGSDWQPGQAQRPDGGRIVTSGRAPRG